MTWRAGIRAVGASIQVQGGRVFSFSRQKIWVLSDRARVEPVVGYRFNAREGRDLIRLVARQLGLKERQPLSFKIPLAMVVATSAFFAIYGLVLLVLRIAGAH